jgi:hypothetical protein
MVRSFYKRLSMVAAVALSATGLATGPARADGMIQWSDTYLSVRYVPENRQPGASGTTDEVAGNIAYANGWTYGSNFVSLDFESFTQNDGANQTFFAPGARAVANSFETYSVFRTVLSGNKIFNTKAFSFGPIADIGLELGGDVDTQDDQFASYKRLVVFGPQFAFAMPKGFWTFSVHFAHEWNTNAYLANNSTSFDPTVELETAWLYPFSIGPVPLKFTGFVNFISPKGKGGAGDTYHREEILARPKLMVDVGQVIGWVPNKIDAGVGFEFWYNKFGNTPPLPSTEEQSVFVEIGYHF